MSHDQLRELGFSAKAIKHRVAIGRLHPLYQGVYAAGRPEVTQHGQWMAAVLAGGEGAVLSHDSAAALWGIRPPRRGDIEVSVPAQRTVDRPGIRPHRRELRERDTTTRHGIPVTTPLLTLIDMAPSQAPERLEAAVNEADKLDLIDPETLRAKLDEERGRRGVAKLRRLLDERTFTLTDSELERRFLPIARKAGLPKPQSRATLNGVRVDFYWPELQLVVETDGLRYHRTPAQQTKDRIRDQAHAAAGLTPLRFTHAQIRYQPDHVQATLTQVRVKLRTARGGEQHDPSSR